VAKRGRPRKDAGAAAPETTAYRHDATRTNIPPAQIAGEGRIPKAKRVKYAYSPHLDPVLRFDPEGRADKVAAIVEKACRGERLDAGEQEILRAVGKNWEQPWLEWAGKQEEHARGHFSVDPVALHIHERISAQAILRAAQREDTERSLFAQPEQSYSEALKFYKHDVDWANRLILGDSLQVMSSLAHRENLAGKVQMIYIDPPYGIKFASNFQPEVGKKDVRDGKAEDLTREPEMVKAYRDTWHLGSSSYLAYLRDRLVIARNLLSPSGSIFVQISDENLHRVRAVLDEVFDAKNFCSVIQVQKTGSQAGNLLATTVDFLLWFSKDRSSVHYNQLYLPRIAGHVSSDRYDQLELPDSSERRLTREEIERHAAVPTGRVFQQTSLISSGASSVITELEFEGHKFLPGTANHWKTTATGLSRLGRAGRLIRGTSTVRYRRYFDDFSVVPISDRWESLQMGTGLVYVVQTAPSVVERCMLMTTEPGDLVLDPTCGSGTTAFVAEQWGRRWITIDTSRVALSITRQRLLTAKFEHYRTKDGPQNALGAENPGSGFKYKTVPHITLGAIAQNQNLDPIFAKHEPILAAKLKAANDALASVPAALRAKLKEKLAAKEKAEGKKSITDADRRRWILPPDNRNPKEKWTVDARFAGWYDWEVPFDTDPDWPKPLQDAVTAYRAAWRAKMDEVNKCISDNAEQEQLVDQPEVVKGVVRVTGPFTVEGVIPEELAMTEDGLVDLTPNEFEDEGEGELAAATADREIHAYLDTMTAHLRRDGVLFPNNKKRTFAAIESLRGTDQSTPLHARGTWEGEEDAAVAIVFGPQYGPITALQVEHCIRAARRYEHLVFAGFAFDPEASAIRDENAHPGLTIHFAHIRPDLNPSMDGLLKDTPNSQLFTVFGSPEIRVSKTDDGDWQVELHGVDIYDPVNNVVRSTKSEKVAAWFLDSDFDGRCFCACQAFFPDQNAWEKIAKALGSAADPEAFDAFKGTVSLPFAKGTHGTIAVKVVDPRGNEVMTVRKLEA